jgi:heme/copper-type cytochrome/quinol oxidase subunit 2
MKGIASDAAGRVIEAMMEEIILPVLIAFLVISALVYIIPALIALLKRRPKRITIMLINILLGWTVIGWIVAFIWSLKGSKKKRKSSKKRKK